MKIEAPRFKRKNISATIVVDVKRFCRQLKTDEVFGTHRITCNGGLPFGLNLSGMRRRREGGERGDPLSVEWVTGKEDRIRLVD